jgi:hypothetical protein
MSSISSNSWVEKKSFPLGDIHYWQEKKGKGGVGRTRMGSGTSQ